MNSKPEPITLFFDYDGTLHDCIRIYAPAFRRVYPELVTAGFAAPRTFSDPELSQWLGLSVSDMWNRFMPELPQERKDYYGSRIGDEMLRLINGGLAALYPGTEETLEFLRSRGWKPTGGCFSWTGTLTPSSAQKISQTIPNQRSIRLYAASSQAAMWSSETAVRTRKWPCNSGSPLSGAAMGTAHPANWPVLPCSFPRSPA